MPTIDSLKKQYDKLTTRERFALLMTARDRDDANEISALIKSAPRKSWSMLTTYGLSEGFDFAGMWYMMEQLGYIAALYFMFENLQPDSPGAKAFNVTFHDRGTAINPDEY